MRCPILPSQKSGYGRPKLWLVVVVVLAVVFVGTGELFEKVGILDRGRDFVVAAGPFAEVDATAAVGAEGRVFASCKNDVAAGGATKCLDLRGGVLRHGTSLILFRQATKF